MPPRLLSAGLGIAIALLAKAGAADNGDRVGGAPQTPASGDLDRARAAYDRGAAAHARGDHGAAARELSLADALVPSAVTLQAALESAILADDPVLAITLCDRASRAAAPPALAELVERARARFGRRVGRVRVTCTAACVVTVDGAAHEASKPVTVGLGHHAVLIDHDGRHDERVVDVDAGATVELVIADSPAPPTNEVAAASPTPAWFITALASTVVAAGVTVGFGVDTANRHAAFVSAGCAGPVHGDCTSLGSDGQAAQLRTNVMVAVTSVLGAATVAAAVLTFRGRSATAPRASVIVGPGPLAALRVPW